MSTQTISRRDADAELKTDESIPIVSIPSSMNTTGPKLVYLYLQVVEETTIEELSETLGMKMLTLYPMLGTLEDEGLVERDGETFALAS